jgi:hypothetical protein
MKGISKLELSHLHCSKEIDLIWKSNKNSPVIEHPVHGIISPYRYRQLSKGKPCPYCGQKMRQGRDYITSSESEAILREYYYINKEGKKDINSISDKNHHGAFLFFHQHYVTLDHKLNKGRFPEKMFDYDNLEPICWRCNKEKSDDNSFEVQHTYDYLDSVVDELLERYPIL